MELVTGAGVGVATALVVVAVMRLAHRVDGQRERGWGMPALLVAGGLATGLLAALADLLGAGAQDVVFSGQASVPDLVEEDSAGIVLVLLAAKGARLRDLPRLRLPRRAGLPGDLPGDRPGDARGDRLRHVPDGGGCDRHGRGDGSRHAAAAAWLTRAALDPPAPVTPEPG